MRYLLDTNVLVAYLRSAPPYSTIEQALRLSDPKNIILVSVVTKGELMAFARKNNWGKKKQALLNEILNKLIILDINAADENLFESYALIDAFSQNKLEDKPLAEGISARNMGKNDLWIAAAACVSNSILVTMDKDFDHLHKEVVKIARFELDGTRAL